jgi:hypothetical protein
MPVALNARSTEAVEEDHAAMENLKQNFQNLFSETDSAKIANELREIYPGFKKSRKIHQELVNQELIDSAFELLGEIANNSDVKIFKSPAIIEIADNVIEYYAPIREKELREAWFQNLKTSVGGHGFSTDRKSETENSKQLLEVREYFKGNPFNLTSYNELKVESGNAQESALSNIPDYKFFAKLMSLSQETQVDFSPDEIKIAYKIMQKEKMSRKIKFVEDVKKYFEEIKIGNKTPEERTAEILRIKGEFEESYKNQMEQEEFEKNKLIIDKAFVNLNKIALNLNSDITTIIFTDEKRSGNTDFEMMRMVNLVISLDRNKRLRDLAPMAMEVGSTMAVNSDSVQLPAPEEDEPSVESSKDRREVDKRKLYKEFLSKIDKEEKNQAPQNEAMLKERKDKLKESLKYFFSSFNPFLHHQKILEMKENFPDPNHIGINDPEMRMSENIRSAFVQMNKYIVQHNENIDFSKEDMQIIEFSLDKAKDRDLAPQTRMQNLGQSKFMQKLSGGGGQIDPNLIIGL